MWNRIRSLIGQSLKSLQNLFSKEESPKTSSLSSLDGLSPKEMRLVWGFILGLFFMWGVVGFSLLSVTAQTPFGGWAETLNIGFVVLVLLIAELTLSIRTINANELGALYFYGQPIYHYKGTGPRLVPFGIFQLAVEKSENIEVWVPGKREELWHGEAESKERNGRAMPLRIVFADTGNEEKFKIKEPEFEKGAFVRENNGEVATTEREITIKASHPLGPTQTQDVYPVIFVGIKSIFRYRRFIGSMSELEKIVKSTASGAVTRELPKFPLSVFLQALGTFQKLIRLELEERLGRVGDDNWSGVEVRNTQFEEVPLSHELNKVLQEVAKSRAKASSIVIDANATADAVRIEADAAAYAEKMRGVGVRDAAWEAGLSPEAILAARTTTAMAEGGNAIIIDAGGGMGQLAGIVGGLAGAMKGFGPKGPRKSPKTTQEAPPQPKQDPESPDADRTPSKEEEK